MTPADIRKLIAGYASGTLSPAEREALFSAALADQSLFNALADEEALRELLSDAEFRGELLNALENPAPGSGSHLPAESLALPRLNAASDIPDYVRAPMRKVGSDGAPFEASPHAPLPAATQPLSPPPAKRSWRIPAFVGLAVTITVSVILFTRPQSQDPQILARRGEAAFEEAIQQAARDSNREFQADVDVAPPPSATPAPNRTRRIAAPSVQQPSSVAGTPPFLSEAPPQAPPTSVATQSEERVTVSPAQGPLQPAARRAEADQPTLLSAPKPAAAEVALTAPPVVAPSREAEAAPAADALAKAQSPKIPAPLRYEIQIASRSGSWEPAPITVTQGTQLRIVVTPPQSGNLTVAINNETTITPVKADQPAVVPLPSSTTGTLRVRLSLFTAPEDTSAMSGLTLTRGKTSTRASSQAPPLASAQFQLEIR